MTGLRSVVPVLRVSDMDRAASFDTGVLSFSIRWEDMDYGSLEFGLRDPDGYVLAFSEIR